MSDQPEPSESPATGCQLVTLARNPERNGPAVKLGFLNVPMSQAVGIADQLRTHDLLDAITTMMADGWRVTQHAGESWYLQRDAGPVKPNGAAFLLSALGGEFAKCGGFSFLVSSPEPGSTVYTITFKEPKSS